MLSYCFDCQHLQIPYILSWQHYDAYDEPDLQYITKHLLGEDRKRQLALLEKYAPQKKLLIDIGCDTGDFLESAQRYFAEVVGIEPSVKSCEILKRKGIHHINAYFTRDLFIDNPIDAFYSSQVFEHLAEPLTVMKDIYAVCRDGAVGIIEVPDGQKIWEAKSFGYVVNEHINYFSPLSLTLLAARSGFSVECCNAYDGKNIEILLRKERQKNKNFTDRRDKIIVFIKSLPQNKRISAFGAGKNSHALMRLIEKHLSITNWYDNNPAVQGRYVVNCATKISAPNSERIRQDDIILLFNTRYDHAIVDELRTKYEYKGEIITIV